MAILGEKERKERMNSKLFRKSITILLTVCLVVALIPAAAFAGEEYVSYEEKEKSTYAENVFFDVELVPGSGQYFEGDIVNAQVYVYPGMKDEGNGLTGAYETYINYDSDSFIIEKTETASGWALLPTEDKNQRILGWTDTKNEPYIPECGQIVATLMFMAQKDGSLDMHLSGTNGRFIDICESYKPKNKNNTLDVHTVCFTIGSMPWGEFKGETLAYICSEYPGLYYDEQCTMPFELPEFEPIYGYKVDSIYKWENRIDGRKYTDDELLKASFDGQEMVMAPYIVTSFKEVVDDEGYKTIYVYDYKGDLIEKKDPYGKIEKYRKYNGENLLISETTPLGYTTQYKYDEKGNLLKKIYADGTFDLYTYNENGNKTSYKSQSGTTEMYEYDSEGRPTRTSIYDSEGKLVKTLERRYLKMVGRDTTLVEEKDAEGKKFNTEQRTSLTTWVTDGEYNLTSYYYDNKNQLIKTVDSMGYVTLNTYDDNGNVTCTEYYDENNQEKGSFNKVTYEYEYYPEKDGKINIKKIVKQDGDGNRSISNYDDKGNLTSETDCNGNTTRYEYDKYNRCTAKTTPLGNRTEYSYDHRGNLVQTREGENGSEITGYYYDDDGRMSVKIDAEGVRYLYFYDSMNRHTMTRTADGQLIEMIGYDKAGNIIARTDGNGNTTRYTYDASGKVLTETDPEGNIQTNKYNIRGERTKYIDARGREASFEYDKNGNVTKVTDKAGNVTTFTYDANNRQTSTVVHAGDAEIVTSFEYDGMDNVVSVTMPNGGIIKSSYDHNNNAISSTDAMGNTEYRGYDGNGNLISLTDFRGNTTKYVYDADNRHIRTIDALGNETAYAYDEMGRLISTTTVVDGKTIVQKTIYDKAGRVSVKLNELADSETSRENAIRYEYDNQGRVSKEIYEDGESYTSYSYDGNGNIVRQSYHYNGKEYIYENIYDKNGQLVSTKDPMGNEISYAYTATGVEKSITDALKGETSYTYDANDNVISIKDAEGNEVAYEYDSQQNVIKVTDANENVYRYEYDKSGNLSKVINPDGGEEVYEYDLNNRLISVTDSENYTTSYSYDANGNVIAVTDANGKTSKAAYDALNRKIAEIDAAGGVTEYSYDALGRVTQVKDADGATTSYEYDAKGRVVRIWDAYDNMRSYVYDPMDRVIEETDEKGNSRKYSYDGLGNVVKLIDELGYITTYSYDLNGNCIEVCNALGSVYRYTYDELNRLISRKDPEGNTVSYEYDSLGNIVKETDGRGNITKYTYDKNGNLIKVTDALGTVTAISYDSMDRPASRSVLKTDEVHGVEELQTVYYAYDHRGLVTDETNSTGAQKSFVYDGNGNLIKSTDEAGKSTLYTYTPLNLLASIKYSDGQGVAYKYDKTGALVEMQDVTGVTSIGVDLLDRVTSVKSPNGKTIAYEYDPVGNLTALTYPDGNKVQYDYDAAGNLLSVYDEASNSKTSQFYDALGQVIHKTYANGEATAYQYDKAGRVTSVNEYMADASLRFRTNYAYDEAGNRTETIRETFENGKAVPEKTRTQLYSYDKLNRLICFWDGENENNYVYDSLGNLVYESGAQGETHYWYNDRNQLTDKIGSDGTNVVYKYDERGNRILERGKEGTYRYSYDSAGNLVMASTPEGNTTKYRYNGLGMRVESEEITHGDYRQEYKKSYFPDFISTENDDLYVEVRGNENFATRYIYAGSERVIQITRNLDKGAEKILYVHEDILGSTSFFTREDGSMYGEVTFDPWGKPEISEELLADKTIEITFTGHPYDKILGVFFAEARFYDPETRAFLSEDPAEDGLNWYQYCAANPVNYWDPTGTSWEWWDNMIKGWQENPGWEALRLGIETFCLVSNIAAAILTVGQSLWATAAVTTFFGMLTGALQCGVGDAIDQIESGKNIYTFDGTQFFTAMILGGLSGCLSGLASPANGAIYGVLGLYVDGIGTLLLTQAATRFAVETVENFGLGVMRGAIKGENFQNTWVDILTQAAVTSLASTICNGIVTGGTMLARVYKSTVFKTKHAIARDANGVTIQKEIPVKQAQSNVQHQIKGMYRIKPEEMCRIRRNEMCRIKLKEVCRIKRKEICINKRREMCKIKLKEKVISMYDIKRKEEARDKYSIRNVVGRTKKAINNFGVNMPIVYYPLQLHGYAAF